MPKVKNTLCVRFIWATRYEATTHDPQPNTNAIKIIRTLFMQFAISGIRNLTKWTQNKFSTQSRMAPKNK